MILYRCEDSLESIFTAIYRAYEEKRVHEDTQISLSDEILLFAEDVPVTADAEKTRKVMRTLKRTFGEEDYLWLCFALSSREPDKAQAVYQTVVRGLRSQAKPGHLFDDLADDYVNRAYKLGRAAYYEEHHLKGFVRFEELENGILYSRIGPKNNVLTFLMPHFADRFPGEHFMIYDEGRRLFGIHPARHPWYLLQSTQLEERTKNPSLTEDEKHYQELFRRFCHTIAIKERENRRLQRNLVPLRFQEYMMEFR